MNYGQHCSSLLSEMMDKLAKASVVGKNKGLDLNCKKTLKGFRVVDFSVAWMLKYR